MLQTSHPSSNIPLYNHIMETNSHQPPSSAATINLNNQHDQQQQQHLINFHYDPIQHMFEKPLTPSDVGKLNRLVIPKQHAEKHFPLDRNQGSVLLSFQDEYRKLWRFRYSYWNSSQSYVFTKGWSRYVKEKHLDVGDVVLFQRHMLDCNKMFIGWRRRAQPIAGGGGGDQSSYPLQHVPLALPHHPCHELDHAGERDENVDAYPRVMVATRRLRLFGVNLECPAYSEPSTPYGSSHGDHQYKLNSENSDHNM